MKECFKTPLLLLCVFLIHQQAQLLQMMSNAVAASKYILAEVCTPSECFHANHES